MFMYGRVWTTGLVGVFVALSMFRTELRSHETACWLSAHWRELVDWLPEPGERWIYRDVRDECPYPNTAILMSKGVVEQVERDCYSGHVYETRPDAYERVMEYSRLNEK